MKNRIYPVEILQNACTAASEIVGSSTGCLVTIRNTKLHAANVGDSRFIVVRTGKVVLSCTEQQLDWNMPYQMGSQSDILPKTHADVYHFDLERNDLIVMGTDGLFDNLFLEEIVSLLDMELTVGKIASNIAKLAKRKAYDTRANTPFKKEANRLGKFWGGGKPDDITVIVGWVK
eukprot:TRINITY_DN7401_c0_g1_i2.p1 TRINITY_DN7401_c0_g1~~TRINITY_DN7401_c0_g1_i2.p1  ORF type:complete len:175 (-),score=47.70 TRINITY_DN7401_c0_g1_i2:630-1154(-)